MNIVLLVRNAYSTVALNILPMYRLHCTVCRTATLLFYISVAGILYVHTVKYVHICCTYKCTVHILVQDENDDKRTVNESKL